MKDQQVDESWSNFLSDLASKEVTCNIENPEECDSCGS